MFMDGIKYYGCRYVCEYQDDMPLSSAEYIFKSAKERKDFLLETYDEDDIDVDTSEHEYGWEFFDGEL
jgi:hypothetical protein